MLENALCRICDFYTHWRKISENSPCSVSNTLFGVSVVATNLPLSWNSKQIVQHCNVTCKVDYTPRPDIRLYKMLQTFFARSVRSANNIRTTMKRDRVLPHTNHDDQGWPDARISMNRREYVRLKSSSTYIYRKSILQSVCSVSNP